MSEAKVDMPSKKEEVGGSYVLRAKLGQDMEVNITGFFRHDVTAREVDAAFDLWANSIKRQQAVASLDAMELQVERGKEQVRQMDALLASVKVNVLAGKRLEDHQTKVRGLTEARSALDFNQKKLAEYKKLVAGEHHAAG